MQSDKPVLIEGGLSVDDRGQIVFCNGFDFSGVKRFYIVGNHRVGQIRAWHGHKREQKWAMAVSGSALVCALELDESDSGKLSAPMHRQPQRFTLSAAKPSVLYIPPGYANGWMSLTDDARLLFFSTATLEESQQDDYRFPVRYWKIEER